MRVLDVAFFLFLLVDIVIGDVKNEAWGVSWLFKVRGGRGGVEIRV